MIAAIASIFTALATIAMAGVAWFALQTWRKEFIGKKKIELSRQIMECAYEVQDALIYARLNRISEREVKEAEEWMKSEKARDPEHTILYPDRYHFLVANRRLEERQDKIDEFRNLTNTAYLYWDKEIFKLFYELCEYTLMVRTAAKDLYYNDTPRNPADMMKMICDTGPDDPVTRRVESIVEEFRMNLEPIYKDHRMPWKTCPIREQNKQGEPQSRIK